MTQEFLFHVIQNETFGFHGNFNYCYRATVRSLYWIDVIHGEVSTRCYARFNQLKRACDSECLIQYWTDLKAI